MALAGDRRGRVDGRPRPAGFGAVGGAVLARVVLPPPVGRFQRLGRCAHRSRPGAAAHGSDAVAPRSRAPLVDAGGCGRPGTRGALRRPLFRAGHHAAGWRRGVRAVDLVGGGGRDGGDGAGARRGGAGARHDGAAAPALGLAGGVRVGRDGRARRPVAVESLRRVARVVHVRVAPGAGGRAGAGAAALGGPRGRDGGGDGGGARHVGRGRGGPAGARGAGRPRAGRRGRPARRVVVGAPGGGAAHDAPAHRGRAVRVVARVAACGRFVPGELGRVASLWRAGGRDPARERRPAAVVAGRAGALARDRPRAASRASPRQPRGPLRARRAARGGRRPHGGCGPAHASHSVGTGRAVSAGRGGRPAAVPDHPLAAVAAARRAERPCDLDATGLVRAGRAPHRRPRRGAPRPSHGGSARSVGAPGARHAGGGGRRGPARGVLVVESRAHGAVASAAAAPRRRPPHQLPGAAGRRARRVLRGPAARARAVELRAAAGRRPPGRRPSHRTDAARRGGHGGYACLRARRRHRPVHGRARQPARRGSLAVPGRGAGREQRPGARRARRGRSVSRARRVRAAGSARRARAHR